MKKDSFPADAHERFIELNGEYKALMAGLKAKLTAEEAAFFDRTFTGAAVDEVERMRRIVLAATARGPRPVRAADAVWAHLRDGQNLNRSNDI